MFERAMLLGMSYTEAFFEDVGFINDLLIEKGNDAYEYPEIGSDVDFKKL